MGGNQKNSLVLLKSISYLIISIFFLTNCAEEPIVEEQIENRAPRILNLEISEESTTPESLINLVSSVTDADGDPITYLWSSEIGNIENPTSSTTILTIPSSAKIGTYTIKLAASDGKEITEKKVSLKIVEGGILTGYIYYKNTKIPIAGMFVSIGVLSGISDVEGKYLVENIPSGKMDIIVNKDGYDTYNMTYEYNLGDEKSIDFEITSNTYTKTIYGKVSSGDNLTYENIIVKLLNPDGKPSNIRSNTDSEGNYQLDAVPIGGRVLIIDYWNNNLIYNIDEKFNIAVTNNIVPNNLRIYINRSYYIDITDSKNWDYMTPDGYEMREDYIMLNENSLLRIITNFSQT